MNSALYIAFVKGKKQFVHNETILEYAHEDDEALLTFERQWKTEITGESVPLRLRIIHSVTDWYKRTLRWFLEHAYIRRGSIFALFALLILSFVPIFGGKSLAWHVGFDLFPGGDNSFLIYTIKGASGERVSSIERIIPEVTGVLGQYREIKFYTMKINDVKNSTDPAISINIFLKKKEIRSKEWLLSVFDFDKAIDKDFIPLRMKWFDISSKIAEWGPPNAKAAAIKLVADNSEKLDLLSKAALDFEKEIRSYPGAKNVENSSGQTPGQFVFHIKKDVVSTLWIAPSHLLTEQMFEHSPGIEKILMLCWCMINLPKRSYQMKYFRIIFPSEIRYTDLAIL